MKLKFLSNFVLISCMIFLQESFGQTIPGTGNNSTGICGDCTPDGWVDSGGTPDISDKDGSGGQGSTGANASWAQAPLPLPPTGDTNWVTLRDVGPGYSEESISTTMGSLVNGKIYKLTLYTMTSLSNNDGGGGGVYYAGTYMDDFDYQIGSNSRLTINTISQNSWGETHIYFTGEPNVSGEMNLTLYPKNGADFQNNGDSNDLEMIHIAVELNAVELLDTDNDGIDDSIDIDDDNDGITDTTESGGNDPNGDEDGDNLPNYLDTTDNGNGGDGSSTNYTDSNNDGVPDVYDNDGDGIANHIDLDSDNDGIPDNIEGQSTTGYIAPTGSVGSNGLYNVYENNDTQSATSFTLINTDSGNDSIPDYLDTDSDNDGVSDTTEANLSISGVIGNNGLYSAFENNDNYSDVNGLFDDTQTDNFPDNDDDVNSGGNVDWRDTDQTGMIDTDLDGIPNTVDIDDDNDGITDAQELCNTNFTSTAPSAEIEIYIDLDDYENETSWSLTGPGGYSQSVSSNTYSAGDDIIIQTYTLTTAGTYTFTINDTWGDGLIETGGSNENNLAFYRISLDGALVFQSANNPNYGSGTSVNNIVPNLSSSGFTCLTSDPDDDDDADGISNFADPDFSTGFGGDTINSNGVWTSLDQDGDGIPNHLDLDSDNDGIPDNIEGQSTLGYIAPSGSVGSNGLYNIYENNDSSTATSFTVINTDGTDNPDYKDTDSDNDDALDRTEANLSLSGSRGLNGLDNNYDNGDNYTDTNGSFDNSQSDNFPDADSDVNSGGDVDYRDSDSVYRDNDSDGYIDSIDLDDDNDGILDTEENGVNQFDSDEDGDGIPNYLDTSDGGNGGDGSTTDYTDSNSDGIPDAYDFDLDGVPNHFDLDSDNDGIPDNIEAQSTTGYIAPTNTFSSTGIDLAYGSGLTPQDTDGDNTADYFDLDSDDDGILDNTEADITRSGNVGNNGLDDSYDSSDDYSDVNGSFDNSQTDNFEDADSDVNSGGDVDYRDDTFTYDTDDDNVNDEIDLDDDNDGIVDLTEYGSDPCSTNSTSFSWDNNYVEGGSGVSNGEDPVETDPTKTISNVGVTLTRTSNVASESNFRVNDFVTTASSYTLAIKARSNASSTHTFTFDTPVKDLSFTLYDLDQDSGTATDEVKIILTSENGTNYTLQSGDYTLGTSHTFSSPNTFTGSAQGGNGTLSIDGISEWIIKLRIVYNNSGTGSISGNQRIAIGDLSFCTPIDSDGDGVFDFRDLDSDNDGIPDNIEAQTTAGYIPPTGNVSLFGIDLAYNIGVTPVNTDGSNDGPDYLDLDSDDDGSFDIIESGSGISNNSGVAVGTFGNNGLINSLDNGDDYADVNGSYDNTISDNFTDSDGDVNNNGGDFDYRDTVSGTDTDGDGVNDLVDIDDDNDGIPDLIENNNYVAEGDEDGDGILNYIDTTDNGNSGDSSATDYTDANSNGIPDVFDNDNDGIANHLDIDADNDGIPDNVEGQSTLGYVAPSGSVGANGLYNIYENNDTSSATSFTVINTDSGIDSIPDYLDSDSDNDGTPDIQENGMTYPTSGTDTDNDGLDDIFEGSNVSDGYDVNDEIDTPSVDLPDTDSDVATQDVDYRDDTEGVVPPSIAGNTLWLRADIGVTGGSNVSNWEDQTASEADFSNGNIATQPDATINELNFNPTVTFTPGNNDVLTSASKNLNPGTLYIVYNDVSTANWTTPFTNVDNFGHGDNNNNIYNATYGVNDVRNGDQYVNGLTTDLNSHDRPDNFELISNLFVNNVSNANKVYYVGRDRNLSGRTIDGSIAEIMLFSDLHSLEKKQQVESYLAIKYGFTLNPTNSNSSSIIEGDYILSDLTTKVWNYANNASYHYDVAGIGRDDGMVLKQKQSTSNNLDSEAHVIIGLGSIASNNANNANSFSSNKDFLVWGNNNVSLTSTTTSTLICAPEKTMSRVWKIVENGNVGSVEISFDETTINTALNTGYTAKVLKVADDASFTTNVQYVPLEAPANGRYSTNYDFNGTKYFTYAEVNGIFWNGDLNSWYGGTGTGGAGSRNTSDRDKVMVIDSQTSLTPGVMSEDARVECLWVKQNSKLVINSGKYIEFDEDFILDGEIRLIDDAQILQTHVGQTNVQGTGKVYLDQEATVPNVYRYHYWSSPVVEVGKSTFSVGAVMKDGTTKTSATSIPKEINFTSVGYDGDTTDPITIANHWIYTYNGAYWDQKLDDGDIARGYGYTMKSTGRSPQNFTFVGTPNDGTINIPVTANTNTLIGNPYPSTVDAIDFIQDNIGVLSGTIYFWQHKGEAGTSTVTEGHNIAGYQGGYSTRNLVTGIAAQAPTDGTDGLGGHIFDAPGRYIPIGQSFFAGSITTGNIVFKNAHRNFQEEDGTNSIFLKGKKKKTATNFDEIPFLKIGFEYTNSSNVEIHRQIGILFKSGLTYAFDSGYDSTLFDLQTNDIYWKFPNNNDKYSIAGIESIHPNIEVPLTVVVDSQKDVKFSLDEEKHINTTAALKDKITGITHQLSSTRITTINLDAGTYSDRFVLLFPDLNDVPLDISETIEEKEKEQAEFKAYFEKGNNTIKIINPDNITINNIDMFNMNGVHVKGLKVNEPIKSINPKGLSEGVYIVKIHTSNGVITQKIAIY